MAAVAELAVEPASEGSAAPGLSAASILLAAPALQRRLPRPRNVSADARKQAKGAHSPTGVPAAAAGSAAAMTDPLIAAAAAPVAASAAPTEDIKALRKMLAAAARKSPLGARLGGCGGGSNAYGSDLEPHRRALGL